MVNWRGGTSDPKYMCILLYVKHIWCSGIPYIYGQLEADISALVYVHSAICETLFGVVVFHTSMVNWRGGSICPKYMCILLSVKLIWCSGIPYIYGQLEGGPSALWYMCILLSVKLIGVAVFHRSMVN